MRLEQKQNLNSLGRGCREKDPGFFATAAFAQNDTGSGYAKLPLQGEETTRRAEKEKREGADWGFDGGLARALGLFDWEAGRC